MRHTCTSRQHHAYSVGAAPDTRLVQNVPQARENQLQKDIGAAFDGILRDLMKIDQRNGKLFLEEVTDDMVEGMSERKYTDVVRQPMALLTIMCAPKLLLRVIRA